MHKGSGGRYIVVDFSKTFDTSRCHIENHFRENRLAMNFTSGTFATITPIVITPFSTHGNLSMKPSIKNRMTPMMSDMMAICVNQWTHSRFIVSSWFRCYLKNIPLTWTMYDIDLNDVVTFGFAGAGVSQEIYSAFLTRQFWLCLQKRTTKLTALKKLYRITALNFVACLFVDFMTFSNLLFLCHSIEFS